MPLDGFRELVNIPTIRNKLAFFSMEQITFHQTVVKFNDNGSLYDSQLQY